MGLTNSSTGGKITENTDFTLGCDYNITLAGNPNTGKSTIFNNLTGMHQHTGNWTGKTVENASGICTYKNKKFLFVDIPRNLFSHGRFRRRKNRKRLHFFWNSRCYCCNC